MCLAAGHRGGWLRSRIPRTGGGCDVAGAEGRTERGGRDERAGAITVWCRLLSVFVSCHHIHGRETNEPHGQQEYRLLGHLHHPHIIQIFRAFHVVSLVSLTFAAALAAAVAASGGGGSSSSSGGGGDSGGAVVTAAAAARVQPLRSRPPFRGCS